MPVLKKSVEPHLEVKKIVVDVLGSSLSSSDVFGFRGFRRGGPPCPPCFGVLQIALALLGEARLTPQRHSIWRREERPHPSGQLRRSHRRWAVNVPLVDHDDHGVVGKEHRELTAVS